MSTITLSLTGNTSSLTANYFPPIELSENDEYVCGLIDFQTYNSIPNVYESNNSFHYNITKSILIPKGRYTKGDLLNQITKYKVDNNDYLQNIDNILGEIINRANFTLKETVEPVHVFRRDTKVYFNIKEKTITIPVGLYEIEDIYTYLSKVLTENEMGASSLSISVNKNTLLCRIKCSHRIDFSRDNSVGSLLGFNKRVLEENVEHVSDKPVNIFHVNTIRIECNLTTGAYLNNTLVHTIHEFFPTVEPGYKIVEVPKNVIYLPVTVKTIHTLNINILDQDDNLIDFRGETITVRIHIKKVAQ